MTIMPSSKKKAYRYKFDPSKNKYRCPACGVLKKFSRYMDFYKETLLPEKYGKCDRENNCGYSLNPYTDGYARSQKDSGKESESVSNDRIIASTKKIGTIPFKYLEDSLGDYDNNQFVQFLNNLLGEEKTKELVERFFIGTSNYWDGSTIFWLIDEELKVRGGQVILYDENGKTCKKDSDGRIRRHNLGVHYTIADYYMSIHSYIPQWITDYKECEKFPFPFGLHQLKSEPKVKPLAIVESAKTAIIATAYCPQYIWLAIGSLSYLNGKRLSYLIGSNITLFPDNGGYFRWSETAEKLSHLNIVVSDLLERKGEEGSDLADYFIHYDWREVNNSNE